jgi:hypothetical protein
MPRTSRACSNSRDLRKDWAKPSTAPEIPAREPTEAREAPGARTVAKTGNEAVEAPQGAALPLEYVAADLLPEERAELEASHANLARAEQRNLPIRKPHHP